MNEQHNREDRSSERRRQRIQEMQRRKKQQMMFRRYLRIAIPLAGFLLLGILVVSGVNLLRKSPNVNTESGVISNREDGRQVVSTDVFQALSAEMDSLKVYSAETTTDTLQLGGEINSKYALMIDLDNDSILAQKAATTRINPASMTKVLTVLVAAEHIEEADLDDTFTITLDITDYGYVHDCSSAGFAQDETVTVRDLFYGTILPSGADAAMGLATYVAGDQESFVELMNDKLKELGLSDTAHFTNCVGVYDEDHYCTIYDMAMIMEAALDNGLCKEVMTAHTYTTSQTEQHPEGIILSNWFLRRIEDKDTGGEVVCGKTGYVVESGNCAVSYGVDHSGKEYVCVTAGGESIWKCIYDHVALYKEFATGSGNEKESES